jgi:hypothetical protein
LSASEKAPMVKNQVLKAHIEISQASHLGLILKENGGRKLLGKLSIGGLGEP